MKVQIDKAKIEDIGEFFYLRSKKTRNDRFNADIRSRIGLCQNNTITGFEYRSINQEETAQNIRMERGTLWLRSTD